MTHDKTLVIDDAVPYAQEIFSHLGQVITLPGKEITRDSLKKADALIVRSRTQVNQALLDTTPVKFVGSTVVGLDHIDQAYLKQRGITFYSAQGCNANSVAEYVITNIVNLAVSKDFKLADSRLAIIGVGHVGKRVADKAAALGMTLLLNDPPRVEQENLTGFVDLDTALSADIITVHTPLNYDGPHPTHHLLSADKLSRIQPHQIIINAARGGIIDEQAWAKTPTKANIIDCWENEPNIDETLYQTALIATPHIAGHALDAKIAGSQMVFSALCDYWETQPKIDWPHILPAPPALITPEVSGNLEIDLKALLAQCYRPEEDDLAIRTKNIIETHKKYEYYRRHYPVHREWYQHPVKKTGHQKFDKALYSLGFQLI
ncbi:4-phosphoerythronate dehydrogenase [Hydrogenovibrio thermophilus]|uniref:Erythronate-4-phosphate dehydrogenase n=1 Tax=Hydrogenovibrio thermophilus TaxID=265883 RepID=A0A451G5A3_9GAMM|nr:4-phosphoerythronate dehydrogenase [Hydrogenovibrio thermophilus]QAB14683.1 4-phosphoerythronate dehydrogenase [Hydrogenovibrio thermophilus]